MKNQQVSVNISLMLKTAVVYLGLALSGWMLLRLIQACLWLPAYFRAQEDSDVVLPLGKQDEQPIPTELKEKKNI